MNYNRRLLFGSILGGGLGWFLNKSLYSPSVVCMLFQATLLYCSNLTEDKCRKKSRVTLSIRQLEEDPLLETLDKVIPQVRPTPSQIFLPFEFNPVKLNERLNLNSKTG